MSKFIEIPDGHEPLRQPANVDVLEDDDNLSISSQDIELAVKNPSVKKSIKTFISDKKQEISNFNAKEFVETKKHEIQAFSLEEFMSDKRRVLFKATAGEFVVTTLFLFVVCAVGVNLEKSGHSDSESLVVSALTTGFCSVALIYSFADVSGAHFNPAVTFATMVTRKTSVAKGLLYMAAQLAASLFSMLLLVIVFPQVYIKSTGETMSVPRFLAVSPGAGVELPRAFVMEMILTFILNYVIFATAFDNVESHSTVKILDNKGNAVDAKHAKNLTIYTASGNSKAGFAPLSIGLTLGFLCFVGGSISGGAFNPARVFGAGVCGWDFDYMWLYWLADFMGAAAAGLLQQNVFATKK